MRQLQELKTGAEPPGSDRPAGPADDASLLRRENVLQRHLPLTEADADHGQVALVIHAHDPARLVEARHLHRVARLAVAAAPRAARPPPPPRAPASRSSVAIPRAAAPPRAGPPAPPRGPSPSPRAAAAAGPSPGRASAAAAGSGGRASAGRAAASAGGRSAGRCSCRTGRCAAGTSAAASPRRTRRPRSPPARCGTHTSSDRPGAS